MHVLSPLVDSGYRHPHVQARKYQTTQPEIPVKEDAIIDAACIEVSWRGWGSEYRSTSWGNVKHQSFQHNNPINDFQCSNK